MSSRIWACTMTSKAVVGSSPITSLGLQARAMAIIARWRMPPESWWGKSMTRLVLMPTRSKSSRVRTMACFSERPSWSMIGSAICLPVSVTGFRAFIAPWKIIEISFQRTFCMPYSVRLARFLPSKRISPETILPFAGRSLRIESAAVVLPQPDSPARPRLSPGSTQKLTFSTARTQPCESLKRVVRSRTSRRPLCSKRSGVLEGVVAVALIGRLPRRRPRCPVRPSPRRRRAAGWSRAPAGRSRASRRRSGGPARRSSRSRRCRPHRRP